MPRRTKGDKIRQIKSMARMKQTSIVRIRSDINLPNISAASQAYKTKISCLIGILWAYKLNIISPQYDKKCYLSAPAF
jgi:hypothetical protein